LFKNPTAFSGGTGITATSKLAGYSYFQLVGGVCLQPVPADIDSFGS
jgi:hypothetical protein